MHEQSIIDTIIDQIDCTNCDVKVISLIASREELTERIMSDVKAGIRTADVLGRSIARIPLYEKLNSIRIETNKKTIKEIAGEISALN